ncbi:MAG: thioredoxin domain-containing protein [Phycisphaerales bacterium JB039]
MPALTRVLICMLAPLAGFCDAAQPLSEPGNHEAALRNEDGSWKYTNRLADSTSPYLLQHAHNPVDWYPWGEAAFERARAEDKVIFLSVGYSTCYWCHVMERLVFSDPIIAARMNEVFVNIKVDREQRPDIDEIYMMATRLVSDSAGWPNSVFLTPDLKPFVAGTYFGPADEPGRPGFPTLMNAIASAWAEERPVLLNGADELTSVIRQILTEPAPQSAVGPQVVQRAIADLAGAFDPDHGGFGLAPKFPMGFSYEFMLDVARQDGQETVADMALVTLRHLAAGGIYDHVGGGFHRYSTDEAWRIPHFEKMLYNQAQLMRAYAAAYRHTGDERFRWVIEDIVRYLDRRMTSPQGGFYSALDAETNAVEGAYYAWTQEEIDRLLDPVQRALFAEVFELADIPKFEGHPHPDGGALVMKAPLTELADRLDRTPAELRAQLQPVLAQLGAARDQRQLPRLDDKVIAGWNGLMIDALAFASVALDDPALLRRAGGAARFVLDNLITDDGLMRIWREGEVSQQAFLEDYALLARAMLTLHRADPEGGWLDHAMDLVEQADARFRRPGGDYYFGPDSKHLIVRTIAGADGAIPAGSSAMVHCLIDLAEVTGDQMWLDRAGETLRALSGILDAQPQAALVLTHGLHRYLALRPDGAIVGEPSIGDAGAAQTSPSAQRIAIGAVELPESVAPGEIFTVAVTLAIDEGWHINASSASAPELTPTALDVRSDAPIEVLDITYPPSSPLQAAYAEAPIDVLAGEVRIVALVRFGGAAPPGPTPVRILVQYQACNDRACLEPARQIIERVIEVRAR